MTTAHLSKLERLRMRRKIADSMIVNLIPWYPFDLEPLRIAPDKEQDVMDRLAELMTKGCNLESLFVSLELGVAMKAGSRTRLAVPSAEKVKALARKMRRVAKEIFAIEETKFLRILEEPEIEKSGLHPEFVDDLGLALPH